MDNVTRPLSDAERTLISHALLHEAERITSLGLSTDLMAVVVGQENAVDEETKRRLSARAIHMDRKATSLELLADVIHRHGAILSTPTIIPEQG